MSYDHFQFNFCPGVDGAQVFYSQRTKMTEVPPFHFIVRLGQVVLMYGIYQKLSHSPSARQRQMTITETVKTDLDTPSLSALRLTMRETL